MMKPTRPNISKGSTYPQEFREEAMRYWLSSGQTLKAVASDLGVTPDCLRDWRRQMEGTPPVREDTGAATASATSSISSTNSASASDLALAREVGQLRRKLEAMTRQRDILKKAISIFSEDKTINGGLK